MSKTRTVLTRLAVCLMVLFVLSNIGFAETVKVEITWSHLPWNYFAPYNDETEWVNAIVAKFEKEHPDVKVKVERLPWEVWQTKITSSVVAGNPPDIYALGSWLGGPYVQDGLLAPIDAYLTKEDKADFFASDLNGGKFGGKYYVWPWFNQGSTLLINLDMCKERGVQLPTNKEMDWTTDQFLEAAKKLTYDSDGDGKIDVYGFPLFGVEPGIHWQQIGWFGSFGADFFSSDGKKIVLNSAQGKKALQFLLDLQDKYKVTPLGAAGLSTSDIGEMFLQSKLAMIYSQADFAAQLEQAFKEGKVRKKFAIGYIQYPHPPGTKAPCTRIGPTGFMVFNQKTGGKARLDAAMALARLITSKEEEINRAKLGAAVPTRSSAAPFYNNYVGLIACNRGKIFFNGAVDESIYAADLGAMFQKVYNHTRAPSAALDDFAKTINAKIEAELKRKSK